MGVNVKGIKEDKENFFTVIKIADYQRCETYPSKLRKKLLTNLTVLPEKLQNLKKIINNFFGT
jgi:hypothetical protein